MTEKPAQEFRNFPTLWGAQFQRENSVLFRIWVPGEDSVHLRLGDRDFLMVRNAEGWCELSVDDVVAGTPYSYVLNDGSVVPDPASRGQLGDVHGPSIVVDPKSYRWKNPLWQPRAWEETVHYELHIGTFTPEGTFRAAAERLAHLADLGITTIEIMPVGQFAGQRGWGYDGVLIYAPHQPYGSPDDFKALIDAAHGLGLNVVLDVIYNHFGPDGNYLPAYAPDFFHPERHTPWGAAIAYEKLPVREFFIENAIYWLEEFHLDGLRLDAIDHIHDDQSDPEIIVEIAQRIRAKYPDRAIHLTTEDNRNITHLHERGPDGETVLYSGEWNDDFHNVVHEIASGETESYYSDFAERHWWKLARTLAEGFAYQGEPSPYGGGVPRGFPSAHLPPTAFVDFVQNHDQIGNRAFGERLISLADKNMVEAMMAILLLSPHIPLLFMGEEFGETRPFTFFTDFDGELAEAVREGRRKEFAKFSAFHGDETSLKQVPDPNELSTFEIAKLNWNCLDTETGQSWMAFTRNLLTLRHSYIVPLLAGAGKYSGSIESAEDGLIAVTWRLNGGNLHMVANLDDEPRPAKSVAGTAVYTSTPDALEILLRKGEMAPRVVIVSIEGDHQALATLS